MDGNAGLCSHSSPQMYSQSHSLHLLPMLLALQVAVPYPCSQQGGNEAPHIPPSLTADTWGACPPTQRQLIKAVFLHLSPSLLMPTNCAIHIYDSSFSNTRASGTAQKYFSVAHNYIKGASHRLKVDLRHKCPKQICMLEQQHSPVAEM